MADSTTAPDTSSEGTGSAPAPEGAPAGTDNKPAEGNAAPNAATASDGEAVTLTAEDAKKLRDANAALRRQVKAAEKAAEEDRKAQLSEAERLAEDKAAFEREKAALAEDRRSLRVRTAVATTSQRIGAIYPDVIEAMVLTRQSELEFDDSGEPTNIEVVLTDIRKSHPNLFRAQAGSADGAARGRQPATGSVNDAIRAAAGRQ